MARMKVLRLVFNRNEQKNASFTLKHIQIPFNFGPLMRINSKSSAKDFKDLVEDWLNNMPKGHFANWVVSVNCVNWHVVRSN